MDAQIEISNLTPRDEAIAFVKSEPNSQYTFRLAGGTEEARRFVQAMRMALSRLRTTVRRRGFSVKPFKMREHSITANADNTVTIILLKDAGNVELAAEIDEVFAEIAGGQLI